MTLSSIRAPTSATRLQEESYRRALSLEMTAQRRLSSPGKPTSKLMFPLPQLYPYRSCETVEKQCLNVYNQCVNYSMVPPPGSYTPLRSTAFDLRNKRIYWTAGPLKFAIEKITSTESQRDASRDKVCWQLWEVHSRTGGFALKQNFFFPYFEGSRCHHQDLPLGAFDGNECEQQTFHPSTAIAIPPMYLWDDWKTTAPHAAIKYRKIIYPLIEKGVRLVSSSLGNRDLAIADIGGGDGELAFRLAKECSTVNKVYLIDLNAKSLALANDRLANSPPLTKRKIEIISGDITKINFLKTLKYEEMDVIVLSGIVAHQVVPMAESINLLNKCKQLLKEDGFILIASHSSCHFNKEDFKTMGFDVLNKSSISRITDSSSPFPFHVEPFYVLRVR